MLKSMSFSSIHFKSISILQTLEIMKCFPDDQKKLIIIRISASCEIQVISFSLFSFIAKDDSELKNKSSNFKKAKHKNKEKKKKKKGKK